MKRSRGVLLTIGCLVWLGSGSAGWAQPGLPGPKKGFARIPTAFRNVGQKVKLGIRRHLPKRVQQRLAARDGVFDLMGQHKDLGKNNITTLFNIGLGKGGKWLGAGCSVKFAPLYATNPLGLATVVALTGALHIAQKQHENILMHKVIYTAKQKGYTVPRASLEWYQKDLARRK